ncbi:hypothetical protein J3R30DRAFT_3421813 [Lentinula aciculospora]|uniref:Uncharacterized protein n=1 Tax=Lentinula aciculospora TaxID=153920 RepID=A0A9W9DXE0_9AGAR|nr:hypothetical protein J3R30DRAFT_3421813 [Lentinula aciculospora]
MKRNFTASVHHTMVFQDLIYAMGFATFQKTFRTMVDNTKVIKIQYWPNCQLVTEVQGFLCAAEVVHVWLQNFALITQPLVELMKEMIFSWLPEHDEAMDKVKDAISTCGALFLSSSHHGH